MKTIGIDDVLRNFSKKVFKVRGGIQKGLTLGAEIVKAESMKNTPVDVGNLRASHYVVSAGRGATGSGGSFNPGKNDSGKRVAAEHGPHIAEAVAKAVNNRNAFVEIGCTAFYAVYVHENKEAEHTTGEAKFLENAIRKQTNKWMEIVLRFAKV